jgi:hypothetical protein
LAFLTFFPFLYTLQGAGAQYAGAQTGAQIIGAQYTGAQYAGAQQLAALPPPNRPKNADAEETNMIPRVSTTRTNANFFILYLLWTINFPGDVRP